MDAPDKPRRDFLFLATVAVAAIGAAALTVPLLPLRFATARQLKSNRRKLGIALIYYIEKQISPV